MINNLLKKYKWFLFLGAVTVVIIVYSIFNPLQSRFFPKCVFHSITGYDCPGCGTQRAIHSLLHGQLLNAIKYNLLFIVSLPYLFIGAILDIANPENNKLARLKEKFYNSNILIAIAIIIIFYWFSRNTSIYINFINSL